MAPSQDENDDSGPNQAEQHDGETETDPLFNHSQIKYCLQKIQEKENELDLLTHVRNKFKYQLFNLLIFRIII